jgi:3-hydroxyisobutyrate dehydrogenase-like beta-hydroxyacid dehydrogenase
MAFDSEISPTIALIGAGEMGSAVGRRLRVMGARVITELKGRSEQSARRAADAGLEVANDDQSLVSAADFVLSIVPPAVACAVAERFRVALSKTERKPVFIECNAISPGTMHRIEEILSKADCSVVDVGIIGGPPPANSLSAGPRIYASGGHAQSFASLARYGLDIVVLGSQIGVASALKLVYAGLTKGFTALGAAMVGAAARHDLADALRAELARSQPDMLIRLEHLLPAMFPKAYRWVAEMEQIAEFAGDEGKGAALYQGAARVYQQITDELEAKPSSDWLSALTAFCAHRRS